MPSLSRERVVYQYQPARSVAETVDAVPLRRGERVVAVSVSWERGAETGSSGQIAVGDRDDLYGYLPLRSAGVPAGMLVDGRGTYLARAGGKLYAEPGAVTITYQPGDKPGTVLPRCNVAVERVRVW